MLETFEFVMEAILSSTNETQLLQLLMTHKSILSRDFNGKNPLDLIDPKTCSIQYLFIVNARLQEDPQQNLVYAARFAKNFTPALAIKEELLHFATIISNLNDRYKTGTILLDTALIWGQEKYLTALHPIALETCLSSCQVLEALILVDSPITEFDTRYSIDIKTFLLYFYYGGMVYLACKHYEKAIEFFKTTFYAPGIVPSAIQLEAYKKWILASLIYHGTAPSLPTHVPIQLQKRFEKGASKYTGMIHLFENFSFKLMEGMFHTNMDEYTLDGNLGLVKQLLEGMVRCKIQNLTKIYLSLSLQDIEKGLGPIALSFIGNKTIRFVVEDMILKKQIYATITDVQGGMVEFQKLLRYWTRMLVHLQIIWHIRKGQQVSMMVLFMV
jgi:COP9 signalosome complex subunit 3